MQQRSISYTQGKGSLAHNNREYTFKNVDESRTRDNITYIAQPIKEAYEECFGASTRRYNEKQTRNDRKRDCYFRHLFKTDPASQRAKSVIEGSNKQKSFYEDIVQIGTMDDSGVGTPEGDLVAKCLDEYMRVYQERNYQLHVFNAVLHMDEATPHLHINYIPWCEHPRGQDIQNGMALALEQMGYGKGEHARGRHRAAERKVLEEICNKYGLQISEPQKSRGSLAVEAYKDYKDKARQYEESISDLEMEEARLENNVAYYQQEQEFEIQKLEDIRGEGELEKAKLKDVLKNLSAEVEGVKSSKSQIARVRDNIAPSGLGKVKHTIIKGVLPEDVVVVLNMADDGASFAIRERELQSQIRKREELVVAREKELEEQGVRAAKESQDLENRRKSLDIQLQNMENNRDYFVGKAKEAHEKSLLLMVHIVRAVQALIYDEELGFGVQGLTLRQSSLIKAIVKRLVDYLAKAAGRGDLANKVQGQFSVEDKILGMVREIESRPAVNSVGYSR